MGQGLRRGRLRRDVWPESSDAASHPGYRCGRDPYAKGHKYLTLVYQIDAGLTRLLWVGKERTIEPFEGFFTFIGTALASKIEFA